MNRLALAALTGGALLLAAPAAFAQASQSEMAAFPMPPASYAATKTFGYVGDYGYYTAPMTAVSKMTANASDYKYVRYSGLSGKKVYVYGAWGTTAIGAPSGTGDNCGHAHSSWGVWGKWQIAMPWGQTLSGWAMLGGGGMSGQRNAANKCVFNPDNPLKDIDPRFGWGATFKMFNFSGGSAFYKDLVVGALSNTHGWGTCGGAGFKACHEPSYIIGYTLP